jgi:hypothetical protein
MSDCSVGNKALSKQGKEARVLKKSKATVTADEDDIPILKLSEIKKTMMR